MSETPWIVVDAKTHSLRCKRCGDTFQLDLPTGVPTLVGLMRGFQEDHEVCPEPAEDEDD